MKIIEITDSSPLLIEQLLEIWENSVKETHLFLLDQEIVTIKKFVPQALKEIPHLIVAENVKGSPVAFMGLKEQKLEMLFVSPKERGKGVGTKLVRYATANYSTNKLTVNEQNPLAKGFYELMGFKVYKRTDKDEQGNYYPILYMKLK